MKISLHLFFLVTSLFVFGQEFSIISQKSIGGIGNESDCFFIPDPQSIGEYFLVSTSTSGISGNKTETSKGGSDVWIVKVDSDFNVLWDKSYGGSGDDKIWSAFIEDDQLFLAINSNSNQSGDKSMDLFGDFDIWMLCLDLNGNITWQEQYGGIDEDYNGRIIPFSDTTFLMICSSRSTVSGNKTTTNLGLNDCWIVEARYLDGMIVNQKSIGTSTNEDIRTISKVSNGNIILAINTSGGIDGDKTENIYGNEDMWFVEIDKNLAIVRQKSFGGSLAELWGNIIEIDGFYYLTMSSFSNFSGNKSEDSYGYVDIWLVKMDETFTIVWDKTIGGNYYDYGSKLFKNANGKLVLIGHSESIPSGNKTAPRYGISVDTWIVLLSEEGELLEQYTLGGNGSDVVDVIEYPNDPTKLIFCGTSDSPSGTGVKTSPVIGGSDIWLGVIDASNVLGVDSKIDNVDGFLVYPNPVKDVLKVNINSTENVQTWISDLFGKQIMPIQNSLNNIIELNVESLNKGIYLLHVTTNNIQHVKKISVN